MAGIIDKFKTMMLGEEEYEEDDEDYINEEDEEDRVISLRSRAKEKAKLVNINTSVQMKVAVISPESYEDAQEICDNIKENRAVVVNLETVEFEISQRIVDFLSGACYSLNGSIQKISNKIFIIAPENIDITGDFKDELIRTKGVFPWVTGIK